MVYEQLISKKSSENGFSVERDYVNKKAYHDKFERLPLNKSVYEMIYKETGRLLEYVDGQSNEYMLLSRQIKLLRRYITNSLMSFQRHIRKKKEKLGQRRY